MSREHELELEPSAGEHWSTRHLDDDEVRTRYARILSRLAGDSFAELVEELELRLREAREQGWLDDDRSDLRLRRHPGA